MGLSRLVKAASDYAPLIVGSALIAAVGGAWISAPKWPFYVLTFALVISAALVWARRGFSRFLKSPAQLGFTRNRDFILFQIDGSGTPRGYFALAFVSWFAVVLTGLRFPYAALAIAGMIFTTAWAADKRHYPAD
jgi:hypothetical protein